MAVDKANATQPTNYPSTKHGKFVLIPISKDSYGHGTHTHAAVWQGYLKELLDESAH